LLTDLGGGSKGKEPQRVQAYIPTKTQRERLQNLSKKITKKGSENHRKGETRKTLQALRNNANHLYIPKRFIEGLACCPIILPSQKISP
jgi:hypothetical protein